MSEQPINIFERLEAREAQATAQRERLWRRAATPLLVIVAVVVAALLVWEGRAVWSLIWVDGRLDFGRLPRGQSSPGAVFFQTLGYLFLIAQSFQGSKREPKSPTATDRILATLGLASFGVWAYLSAGSTWAVAFWVVIVGVALFGFWIWGDMSGRKKRAKAR